MPLEWRRRDEVGPNMQSVAEVKVVSFNMLAPCYKRMRGVTNPTTSRSSSSSSGGGSGEGGGATPSSSGGSGGSGYGVWKQDVREADLDAVWSQRARETVDFVENELLPSASVVALQEYWLHESYASMFQLSMNANGFEVRVFKRPGKKADSVALAVRLRDFEIKGQSDVQLCAIGDRVALVLWLSHRASGKTFLVANTHLSFPHNLFDRNNQILQMRNLIEHIESYARANGVGPATRIIAGDFNVEDDSDVCEHLRSRGYHSAFEVCPPMQDECRARQQAEEEQAMATPQPPPAEAEAEAEQAETPPPGGDLGESILRWWKWGGGRPHMKKFVTHMTHLDEELGVDHIFIKQEEVPPTPAPASLSSTTTTTTTTTTTPATTTTLTTTLFVADSHVIPSSLPISSWAPSFRISDHRPIAASVVLATSPDDDNRNATKP